MKKLSKKQRSQVGELLKLAHTRELSRELETLEGKFRQWRASKIDVFELDDHIHEHYQGPSRKIWKMYSSVSDWELALPAAIHRGFLAVEDFPDDLWIAIGPRVEEIRKGLFDHA